jgi:hypothetical protein
MNDDFLYTRQESPAPEFVAELQERLGHVDSPRKAKRKNGQKTFAWKAAAAMFVVTVLGLVVFSQERLRTSIINIFVDDPNYDLLAELDSRYGFELPTVPSRYQLSSVRNMTSTSYAASGGYSVEIHWQNSDFTCLLELTAELGFYPWTDENNLPVEPVLEENQILLNEHVVGTWYTPIDPVPSIRRRLVWWNESAISYTLDAPTTCMSLDEFLAIAQSTLSESP